MLVSTEKIQLNRGYKIIGNLLYLQYKIDSSSLSFSI